MKLLSAKLYISVRLKIGDTKIAYKMGPRIQLSPGLPHNCCQENLRFGRMLQHKTVYSKDNVKMS